MAALESKLESYEKENKRLHAALEQSDKYIDELENRYKLSSSSIAHQKDSQSVQQTTNSSSELTSTNSGDQTCGESITSPSTSSSSALLSSKTQSSKKAVGIGNERFYGSPSKANNSPNKYVTIKAPVRKITPFHDRIKKSLDFNSATTNGDTDLDFDLKYVFTRFIYSQHGLILKLNNFSHSGFAYCNGVKTNSTTVACSNQLLSSPMKRLRLEEASSKENDPNSETERRMQEFDSNESATKPFSFASSDNSNNSPSTQNLNLNQGMSGTHSHIDI